MVSLDKTPHNDTQITQAELRSIRALAAGEASKDEQILAFKAILWICGTDDMEFTPDEHGGERGTAFKGGKRFVGTQLRKLVNLPLELLIGKQNG